MSEWCPNPHIRRKLLQTHANCERHRRDRTPRGRRRLMKWVRQFDRLIERRWT